MKFLKKWEKCSEKKYKEWQQEPHYLTSRNSREKSQKIIIREGSTWKQKDSSTYI